MKRVLIFTMFLSLCLGTFSATFARDDQSDSTSTESSTTQSSEKTTKGKNTLSSSKEDVNKESNTSKDSADDTKENKAADAIAKCEAVQAKINSVSSRYDKNKTRNVVAYQNMVERIQKFVARFNAKGLDTTTLSADLVTLNAKVTKLSTDYATYITALNNTKNFVCGKSEGQFKTALEDARKQMQVVHQDIADIHGFYKVTLRADLLALKTLVEKTENSTESKTNTEDTENKANSSASIPSATTATKETENER